MVQLMVDLMVVMMAVLLVVRSAAWMVVMWEMKMV